MTTIADAELFVDDDVLPTNTEIFDFTKSKIQKAFKNVGQNIKNIAKKALDVLRNKDIPQRYKDISEFTELRKELDNTVNRDNKIFIVREMASRLGVTPISLLAIFISIGVITTLTGIMIKKDNDLNIRGSSIDRHRSNMKQFNMAIDTTMHQKQVGQL